LTAFSVDPIRRFLPRGSWPLGKEALSLGDAIALQTAGAVMSNVFASAFIDIGLPSATDCARRALIDTLVEVSR